MKCVCSFLLLKVSVPTDMSVVVQESVCVNSVLPFSRSIEAELEPYWLGRFLMRSVLLVSTVVGPTAFYPVSTCHVKSRLTRSVHAR